MTNPAFVLAALLMAPEPTDSASLVERCQAAVVADPAACDSDIAAATEPELKARLLMRRAYGLVEKYRYEEAIADLTEAIRLDPAYPNAYHERAYVWGELRDFDRALADSDKEVELRPEAASAYEERAYLRLRAGKLGGAYEDRRQVARLKAEAADTRIAESEAALWVGRFDEARAAASEALRLARLGGDAKVMAEAEAQQRRINLWSATSKGGDPARLCDSAMEKGDVGRPNLIGDCTAAFLGEADPARKAEWLTTRSLAWTVAEQNLAAAILDQEVAVGLDPDSHDLRTNLGGSYVRQGHSRAGLRELDRALAIKESWVALANRAAAKYNLKDEQGAFEDAKRSFELNSNPLALIVLGDISKDRSDVDSAKLYWMGAYGMGSRDDGLIERLKSIGIDRPDRERRKK